MRSKGGLLVTLTVVAVALVATPAHAASSRAEYVAQVDPICQSAIPALKSTVGSANRAIKHFYRDVLGGSEPHAAYRRLVARIAGALFRLSDIVGGLETKISAVSVPQEDSGYITLWLRDLSSAKQLMSDGARAFKHHNFAGFRAQWGQAVAVLYEADRWVGGLGFHYCTD